MADTTAAPAATTTELVAQEIKIRGIFATLLAEIEAVPGEASSFLANAKSFIANAAVHLEAHFTRAKAIAVDEAAASAGIAAKADAAKVDGITAAVKAAV